MSSIKDIDFNYLIQNQKRIKQEVLDKRKSEYKELDFRIVSFKIGDEYYGIDIMSVKEILKEKKFTKVPNALEFVIGVLNLRGDIMPVINLAKMFNLDNSIEQKDLKSIIVIKVENLMLGLVVEQIQHVISLSKSSLQPPSPLLGSINKRYIDGVVDIDNRLYVILDTDAIFSDKEKAKKEILPQGTDISEEFFTYFCNQIEEFGGIHIHEANKNKFRELYKEYMATNNVNEMPKINQQTASSIISKFSSKHTGDFWNIPYVDEFTQEAFERLQQTCTEELKVLDVGCDSGHEAVSLLCSLDNKFHDAEIKLTAVDSNLSAISNASGMQIDGTSLPNWINIDKYFMNLGGGSYKLKKDVNDKIYFEFHDARNLNNYTKTFDLVVARDLSLYTKESEFNNFIEDAYNRLEKHGILLLGDNETISSAKFKHVGEGMLSIYIKI